MVHALFLYQLPSDVIPLRRQELGPLFDMMRQHFLAISLDVLSADSGRHSPTETSLLMDAQFRVSFPFERRHVSLSGYVDMRETGF